MTTGALPDLAALKLRLGVQGPNSDELLQRELDVATSWVVERVYPPDDAAPGEYPLEVGEAMLVAASRWYARRNTPEGIAGWNELGLVHVMASDPDLELLLERHADYTDVGIA